MNLENFGYNEYIKSLFDPHQQQGMIPARIALEHKNLYHVFSELGELTAEVSGRMRHEARSRADFPSVGDWVAISPRQEENKGTIHALIPRKGSFSRKVAGIDTEEQVVAANVDTVFLVSGLDHDFNVRRIERYLTLAWDSGATPVIVLNKSDVCDDIDARIEEVESVAFGIPVHPVSAALGTGLEALHEYTGMGKTVALLGSSGVGKSTIINSILGEDRMKTQAIREDDSRGRHTTTHRELILIPDGGILIDTPGMREIQLWGDEDGLSQTFQDVEEIIANCKFTDCGHDTEPGCAIKAALEDGTLDPKRYKSYQKLQRELRHLARQQGNREARAEKREWFKMIARHSRDIKEMRKRGLR